MSIINIVLAAAVLWIVPYVAGNGFCEIFRIEKTMPKLYLLGLVAIWGFAQVVTVPLVLVRASFLAAFAVLSIWTAALCAWGIYKRRFPVPQWRNKGRGQKTAVLITGALVTAFLLAALLGQHTDADDSRFVVNAVDILRTNRMYLTDPNTGAPISTWLGELSKDVTAPWAVYLACCGKLTGLSPTVIAHTFLPVAILTAILGVWWMLSEEFFGKDVVHRCVFLDILMILNLYGYFSVYSAETFTMVRLWQGKAVIAGLGIPAMFLICFWIYRHGRREEYVCLALLDLAMCFMSGMGVIIGALLLGCFGLLYGLFKKNWKTTLYFWMMIIPNAVYYLIYYLIKQG